MAQMPPDDASNKGPTSAAADTAFVKPGDRFWSLYIEDAEKYDKVRLERWEGDADGVLVFTGLFAATVATFVVTTIPNLSPDSGDESAILLAQVLSVLMNQTRDGAVPATAPPDYSFDASTSSVWINSLWLVSLVISLLCALAATLVQQWTRIYLQETQRRGSPSARGPVYAALATEIENFRMEDAISCIIAMLHIAVFLFLGGLLVKILQVNHGVGIALAAFLATGAFGYIVLTLFPIATYRSPYRTPLSGAIRRLIIIMLSFFDRDRMLWFQDWFTDLRDDLSHLFDEGMLSVWGHVKQKIREWRESVSASAALGHLRAGSVAADVSEWTDDEWQNYHHAALYQLRESLDQLDEAEEFCDSLISLLSKGYASRHVLDDKQDLQGHHHSHRRSFGLRHDVAVELGVFDLLRALLDEMSQTLADEAGNHQPGESTSCRIILAVSLIQAFMRDYHLYYRILASNSGLEVRVLEMDDLMISFLNSDCFGHIDHECIEGLSPQNTVVWRYSLASIRAEIFAVYLDRAHYEQYPSVNIFSMIHSSFFTVHVPSPNWLHSISEHLNNEAPEVVRELFIRQAMLDNFLWIFKTTIDIVSNSDHPVGRHVLQETWIPLVRDIFWKVPSSFPDTVTDETRADLRCIVVTLGLASADDDAWLVRATNVWDIRANVNQTYASLFEDKPDFASYLSSICTDVQIRHEDETLRWMRNMDDPFDVWAEEPETTRMEARSDMGAIPAADTSLQHEGLAMPDATRGRWSSIHEAIRSVFRRRRMDENELPMTP